MGSKQINPNDWWFDEKAKSLAYFAKTSPVKVNKSLLTELKEIFTFIRFIVFNYNCLFGVYYE